MRLLDCGREGGEVGGVSPVEVSARAEPWSEVAVLRIPSAEKRVMRAPGESPYLQAVGPAAGRHHQPARVGGGVESGHDRAGRAVPGAWLRHGCGASGNDNEDDENCPSPFQRRAKILKRSSHEEEA